jgi:hypothetical protein
VTVRLHNCTMMCSLRDEVSQDVSNLQTSKLKPAVQQNSCSLLSPHIHHLSLSLPCCPALPTHVTGLRAMQPLQLKVSTDVLAPPKARIKVTLKSG